MRRSHGSPVARSSGPGHAQLEQRSCGDDAGVLHALEQDLVAVEQRLVLVDARAASRRGTRGTSPPSPAGCPRSRRRPGSSACAGAARTTSRTGRGSRSRSRSAHQSIVIAPMSSAEVPSQNRWLAIRFSSRWITRRYWARGGTSSSSSRLDGHAVGHRVEVVGEVVHPLDERDDLPVLLVLAALLDAGVHVADDRLDVAHHLALERAVSSRSTPWVAGWCGPMLIVNSSSWLDAPAWPVPERLVEPLERHGLLALAVGDVERVVAGQSYQRGISCSLKVNSTGSPPIGKSRRWG